MLSLDNPIRPYAWGSTTTIPELRGLPPTGEPQAELWMGAHPASPSSVRTAHGELSLPELIAADPAGELGPVVRAEFGDRLPYLLKLLAAAAPLSLQAHPNPALAREGFERENAAGIPLDAPNRTYQDPYAKPEMICALTPLEALVGFRALQAARVDVERLGLGEVLGPCLQGDLRSAVLGLLALEGAARARVVGAVVDAARRTTESAGSTPDPIAAVLADLGERYPGDQGIPVALLMNLVRLEPGDAVLLPAGNLHAYLEGFGVELLANSDNVLRGGFTHKHVDVPELARVLDFTAGPPRVVRAEPARSSDPPGAERVFASPAPEFRLSVVELTDPASGEGGAVELDERGPQILLCTRGSVEARSCVGAVTLAPGTSAYASAKDGRVTLRGTGTVFRATAGIAFPATEGAR